jgi:hypothetical protein
MIQVKEALPEKLTRAGPLYLQFETTDRPSFLRLSQNGREETAADGFIIQRGF